MTTIDWGHPGFSFVNVVEAFAGIDPTGVADSGPGITTALTKLAASGQTAYFPPGTYKITTAVTNASACAILLGVGATFTGSGTTVTQAVPGAFALSEVPANGVPTLQIAQAVEETIQSLSVRPTTGKQSGTAPGPFADVMQSVLNHTTYDNVFHRGYNYPGAAGYVSTEPTVIYSIESNWEATAGNQWVESHWSQIYDPNSSYAGYLRPLSLIYQRAESTSPALPLGCLHVNVTFSDGEPGHAVVGQGQFGIQEVTAGQVAAITTNALYLYQTNYTIRASSGVNLFAAAGSAKMSSALAYVLAEAGGDVQVSANGAQPSLQLQAQVSGVGIPLGGYIYGPTPFQWYLQSQALAHGGTTTLAGAKYIAPTLELTDTGLTSAAIVVFPTTTGPAEWCVDLTGVTFGGQTVTLEVGTATKTVVVLAQSVVRIYSDGVGKLYAWTAT